MLDSVAIGSTHLRGAIPSHGVLEALSGEIGCSQALGHANAKQDMEITYWCCAAVVDQLSKG